MNKFSAWLMQSARHSLTPGQWLFRLGLTALSGLALAGCVSLDQMRPGLESLMGKNEQFAFSVLGYPTSKQQYGTDTVYIWSVRRSGVVMIPQTATTYGVVDNKPMYGTTTYTQAVRVVDRCRITMVADKDGTLKHYQYNGDVSGCDEYIDKLKAYQKSGTGAQTN